MKYIEHGVYRKFNYVVQYIFIERIMIVKELKKANSNSNTAEITIPKKVLDKSKCQLGDNFSITSDIEGVIVLERVRVERP